MVPVVLHDGVCLLHDGVCVYSMMVYVFLSDFSHIKISSKTHVNQTSGW